MFKDDYVLRHVRLFVQAIARLIGLIKEGDLGFALETIRVSFSDYLGMGLDDFLDYPDERLKDFLYFGELGAMGLNRAAFASALLLQAGRIFDMKGNRDRALLCFEKTLRLLVDVLLAEEEAQEMPPFSPAVEDVLAEVELAELKDATLLPLVFYLERQADLERAHAAVQRLLSRNPGDPDTADMARSFYEYLLDESDEKLAEGRLPRIKVQAALDELKL